NRMDAFEWVFVRDRSERQVVQLLRDAMVLVFLNIEEGLPRAPLEAMASGCLVAAFDGGPLSELIPKKRLFRPGDILAVAQWLERVAAPSREDAFRFAKEARENRSIAEKWSRVRQSRSLVDAWTKMLA